MKKFRLFAMVAALAMMSTVFAAWNFINYAEKYESSTVKIESATVDKQVIGGEAIDFSVVSTQALKVSYAQKEAGSYIAKATVNGDVTAMVVENEEGARDLYSYSFKVYGPREIPTTKINTEDLVEATIIEPDSTGKITITAEQIAEYLDYDFGKSPTKDDLEYLQAAFDSIFMGYESGVYVKIYATKIA